MKTIVIALAATMALAGAAQARQTWQEGKTFRDVQRNVLSSNAVSGVMTGPSRAPARDAAVQADSTGQMDVRGVHSSHK